MAGAAKRCAEGRARPLRSLTRDGRWRRVPGPVTPRLRPSLLVHQRAPRTSRSCHCRPEPDRKFRRISQRREVVDADLRWQPKQRPVLVFKEEVEIRRGRAESECSCSDEEVLESERNRCDITETFDVFHHRISGVMNARNGDRTDPDRNVAVGAERLLRIPGRPCSVLFGGHADIRNTERCEILYCSTQYEVRKRSAPVGSADDDESPRLGSMTCRGKQRQP